MEQKNRKQPATRQVSPQKKRLNKKSKWKRRKRIAIVCLPFLAVILLIGFLLSSVLFFKIESYQVEGTNKYTAEQVWAASGLTQGKSMFLSDLGDAEEKITVDLPYIESVKIRRKLPHTLTFSVVQGKADMAVQINDQWLLMSASGKVIEILGNKEPSKGIMRLKLSAVKSSNLGRVIEFDIKEDEPSPIDVCKSILDEVNKTALKGKITMVDISDANDVTIVYDGRIRLHVGVPSDLSAKLNLAAGAVEREDKIDPKQTGELNLTVLQEAYFRPDRSKDEEKETEPQPEAAQSDEVTESVD